MGVEADEETAKSWAIGERTTPNGPKPCGLYDTVVAKE